LRSKTPKSAKSLSHRSQRWDDLGVDKSTEEVSFTLNYPNGLPTTIKQDPEAELILNKTEEVHVKSEPEAEF